MSGSKEALLNASAQEFARRGLHGTRIQAITARAGLNERMIYVHFGSKQALYQAVLESQLTGLSERWSPFIEEASLMEPYTGMRHALCGFFEAIIERPLLVAILLHEALDNWQTLPRPTMDMLPAPLRVLYERGQEQGVFFEDRPFELAYGIVMSALFALPVYLPRFADLLKDVPAESGGLPALPSSLREDVVSQLLDGMCHRPGKED